MSQSKVAFDSSKFELYNWSYKYDGKSYNYKALGRLFNDQPEFQAWHKKAMSHKKRFHIYGLAAIGSAIVGTLTIQLANGNLNTRYTYIPMIISGASIYISMGNLFAFNSSKRKSISALEGSLSPRYHLTQQQPSLKLQFGEYGLGLVMEF